MLHKIQYSQALKSKNKGDDNKENPCQRNTITHRGFVVGHSPCAPQMHFLNLLLDGTPLQAGDKSVSLPENECKHGDKGAACVRTRVRHLH